MAHIIIQGENSSFGKTEEFRRPAHADFSTTKELKDNKFSGVRQNSLTSSREIWVDGEILAYMSEEFAAQFPDRWDSLYRETFGLD